MFKHIKDFFYRNAKAGTLGEVNPIPLKDQEAEAIYLKALEAVEDATAKTLDNWESMTLEDLSITIRKINEVADKSIRHVKAREAMKFIMAELEKF